MQTTLTHGSTFSGIGGFELGAQWAGIETIWNCEYEAYQRKVLAKNFPHSKQYNDVRTITNPPFANIISGGFPCQDISIAGKGKGITGERSGHYAYLYGLVRAGRPDYAVMENSPELTVRGFERILCDFSAIGYDVEWQCLSGTTFGVQQGRERIYIIAYPHKEQPEGSMRQKVFRKPYLPQQLTRVYPGWRTRSDIPEPRTIRSANDLPDLVDRVGSLGNAVMPLVALYLFECIKRHHTAARNRDSSENPF